MAQKSKTSPLQSTGNESVSGHLSTLSSESELSKLEQRFTTDSMEHTSQVSLLCFTLFFCGYEDAGFLMQTFQ